MFLLKLPINQWSASLVFPSSSLSWCSPSILWFTCLHSNLWRVVSLAFSLGVVQQKVLGIIPSSTAGGAQTFTAFQPRTTAALSIRPGTPTSQQQVQLLVLKLVFVFFLVLVLVSFHPLVCSAGPNWRRTNSSWHDCDPNTDPADGTDRKDHTKDTPGGPAR